MDGEHVAKRIGWTVFALGVVALIIEVGNLKGPAWPVVCVLLGLLVVGATRRS